MSRTRRLPAAGWLAAGWIAAFLVPPALGQESASYDLSEHAFNAGGHPAGGIVSSSAGYRMSLDAIGGGLSSGGLASSSFSVQAGFVLSYPPPGEVKNLKFTSAASLTWDVDSAAAAYEIYRDVLSALPGGSTGTCLQAGVAANVTTDPSIPASGFFYLVTSRNSLGEEGTKGFASSGAERPNPLPCP